MVNVAGSCVRGSCFCSWSARWQPHEAVDAKEGPISKAASPRGATRYPAACFHRRPRPDEPCGGDGAVRADQTSIAAAGVPWWKSASLIHMRCSTVASLRASATFARFVPRRCASLTPQSFSADHLLTRVSSTCAASNRATLAVASPTLLMAPALSVSPDWFSPRRQSEKGAHGT